jgi:hypothetical protein
MGFMDKAKRLAEQAQQKLEEAQTQINATQPAAPAGAPPVQYDDHGRPIAAPSPADPSAPDRPHGDPVAPPMTSPVAPPMTSAPAPAAATIPGPPPADAPPAVPGGQGVPQDRNTVDYTPPQVTSGDPLAG